MKYFIDTEFLEGKQKERFPISLFRKETPNTIDLISIGIVSEDITKTLMKPADVYSETVTYSRKYYAISKDFNLKEAWNRFDVKVDDGKFGVYTKRVYWLRENVLYPIFWHLYQKEYPAKSESDYGNIGNFMGWFERKGTGMNEFKKLLDIYGKTNNEIAEEIKEFVRYPQYDLENTSGPVKYPEFYAYYADYDWVVFCWLFGKMMDLPKGFPMYCKDLKQMMDEKQEYLKYWGHKKESGKIGTSLKIKEQPDYPQQTNEHDALADARWNKELYEFLKQL